VPFEDLEYSTGDETWYVMIGMSSIGGLLFVSFRYSDEVVRLISGGRAEEWDGEGL